MSDQQKRKPGRPAVAADHARKNRIVVMADDSTKTWLDWHSAETGASVSEIIRRAVAAYRSAQS
jgi:Ribbon-helix-helix protein, copG family